MSANKSTLIEYLTDSVSYDSSWAIYAERVEGKWKPESFARFGQCIYENGGLMDDCELFRTYEHNTKVDPQNFAAFSVFNKFALRVLGETSVWYFNEGISAQGVIRNQFFPNDRNGISMALTYINREEQKRIATIRKQISTQLPSPLSHRKADDARAFLAELRKAENTGS